MLSNDTKHNFRHDHLNRGICMRRCMDLMSKYDNSTQLSYYQEKFDNVEVIFDFYTIREAVYYKNKFEYLINECMNHELKEKYGLMASSETEYCIEKNEKFPLGECGRSIKGKFLRTLI